jgi:hypothetical protein
MLGRDDVLQGTTTCSRGLFAHVVKCGTGKPCVHEELIFRDKASAMGMICCGGAATADQPILTPSSRKGWRWCWQRGGRGKDDADCQQKDPGARVQRGHVAVESSAESLRASEQLISRSTASGKLSDVVRSKRLPADVVHAASLSCTELPPAVAPKRGRSKWTNGGAAPRAGLRWGVPLHGNAQRRFASLESSGSTRRGVATARRHGCMESPVGVMQVQRLAAGRQDTDAP